MTAFLLYQFLSRALYKPPPPKNHREDMPIDWNIITYAADLIETDHHSTHGDGKGIGGWTIGQALHHALYYYGYGYNGKFASIIDIFDNVVPPPADQSKYSLWYVDWEWEIHRSTEDVVKVLRQMADLCLEQGFSRATE